MGYIQRHRCVSYRALMFSLVTRLSRPSSAICRHSRGFLVDGVYDPPPAPTCVAPRSQIRQAIMETMLASRSTKTAEDGQASVSRGLGQRSLETSGERAVAVAAPAPRMWFGASARPEETQTVGTPLMCTLWCAIAIGALVQGQPPPTVSRQRKKRPHASCYTEFSVVLVSGGGTIVREMC